MPIERDYFTKCVHSVQAVEEITGAIIPPIFQTSTFVQQEPGVHKGYDYSRADNPTRELYERALAKLEGAQHGLAFSSGLAAEQAIAQTLDPGMRVLVSDDVYGGTGRLFRRLFAKYGIEFEFLDLTNENLVADACRKKVDMIWVETPTNPTMKIVSIAGMAKYAKNSSSVLVVDNTFASPLFQSPLALGADVVIHSTTKYIGGHSDLIGGAIMTSRQDLFEKLKFIQFAGGAVPGPFECFLLMRSIGTLAVRMEKHEENARKVADFLKKSKHIKKVYYPGHTDHQGFDIACKQMRGHSGMMSFEWGGPYQEVVRLCSALRKFRLAESLGGIESLINHPERMTHASVPAEMRQKLGITPGLLRLSVGIESAEDLIEDLDRGFSAAVV